jgi:serine protease Do
VRLMGIQRKELPPDAKQPKEDGGPKPIIGKKGGPGPQGPAAKLYVPKPGFANYYFNKVERTRLLDAFKKHGDFTTLAGDWSIDGTVRLKKLRTESKIHFDLVEEKAGASIKPVVRLKIEEFDYSLEPLKDGQDAVALRQPETSGGLLLGMWLYKDFLTQGEKAFIAQGETDPINQFHHGGYEPLYPPPTDGKTPPSLASLRVDCEVINSKRGPFFVKWFFARNDQKLIGMEVRAQEHDDPCEIFFSDYRPVDGRMLPHRMQVQHGDAHYGTFTFTSFKLAKN